jgi:hypothetical protein
MLRFVTIEMMIVPLVRYLLVKRIILLTLLLLKQ